MKYGEDVVNNIEDQEKIRNYIIDAFEDRKKSRPQYSLRSFASKIQVSPGNLSQFFNKKKVFNKKTLEKILYILEPNPETRKEFLHDYNSQLVTKIKQQAKIANYPSKKIGPTSFDKVKDPIFFNFLNMLETEFYKTNEESAIVKKLGMTQEAYEAMINVLINEELVNVDETGKLSRRAMHLKTDDDIASEAIRFHHKKVIEKSITALETIPVDLRDITSLTLPVNLEQMPKAKELIRKFQDDMIHLLNQGSKSEVYHLSVALFPANKTELH